MGKRPLTLEQRKELGERAVERAIELFRDLGFKVERTGVEHRYSPEELEKLRESGEISPEERYYPDLRVSALVEVKLVTDLSEPIFPLREWWHQLRLQLKGEHVVFAFVSPSGECRLVSARSLWPQLIFCQDQDRDRLSQFFPEVPLRKLKRPRGSGEPFARVSLGPKRPAIYCWLRHKLSRMGPVGYKLKL
jgi:hypothetical protein